MLNDTGVSSLRELSDPHGSLRIDDSHGILRIEQRSRGRGHWRRRSRRIRQNYRKYSWTLAGRSAWSRRSTAQCTDPDYVSGLRAVDRRWRCGRPENPVIDFPDFDVLTGRPPWALRSTAQRLRAWVCFLLLLGFLFSINRNTTFLGLRTQFVIRKEIREVVL